MLTYSTRRKTFFKQHLTFAAKPWKEARGKETIKRSFQVTNLLVWANKRMGLAFGMCGYPKEGGNKNSPQRKFTESSSLAGGRSREDSALLQTNRAWAWPHLASWGCAGRAVGRAFQIGDWNMTCQWHLAWEHGLESHIILGSHGN